MLVGGILSDEEMHTVEQVFEPQQGSNAFVEGILVNDYGNRVGWLAEF
jgi:hypothetical protein